MQIGGNLITAFGLFGVCGLMLIALLATWPSTKAYQKGRNFSKWYIFSLFLFPVALVASFVIAPSENRIRGYRH
jgi:hypothetical protein